MPIHGLHFVMQDFVFGQRNISVCAAAEHFADPLAPSPSRNTLFVVPGSKLRLGNLCHSDLETHPFIWTGAIIAGGISVDLFHSLLFLFVQEILERFGIGLVVTREQQTGVPISYVKVGMR